MKKSERFEPLSIISYPGEGLLNSPYALDIAKHTVKAYNHVIKNKLDSIVVLIQLFPIFGTGLYSPNPIIMTKDNYLDNIKYPLEILERNEEYELCAELMRIKDILPTVKYKKQKTYKSLENTIQNI